MEQHPNYKSNIYNDVVELSKTIKTLIHDPVHSRYLNVSLTDSLKRLTSCKQGKNEGLLTYNKCFKQVRDILNSSVDDEFLHTFVENTEEYKKEQDYTKKTHSKQTTSLRGQSMSTSIKQTIRDIYH